MGTTGIDWRTNLDSAGSVSIGNTLITYVEH